MITKGLCTDEHQHITAIVNPAAGSGRSLFRWRKASRLLASHNVFPDVLMTSFRGHAEILTRQAIASGAQTVVAVGGDGTVHEVVNGFLDGDKVRGDVRLGIIPAGTGMDFARNIDMPRTIDAAVRHLISRSERRIDVGISTSDRPRIFVNFAETGLGASVVAREATFGAAWPGRISYLMAAMAAAVSESNSWASISVDGNEVYKGPLVSAIVANGRYFGGGMKIAPHASVQDGLFDVLVLGDFSKAELIGQIWKIYPGFHVTHRKVLSIQGSQVSIVASPGTQLDLDGELSSGGPYTFRILPDALCVLA